MVCHGLIIFKTAHFASLFFSLSLSLSLFLSPSLPLSLSQAAFFLAVIVSIPGEQEEEEEDEEALSGKLKMATALDASDEIKYSFVKTLCRFTVQVLSSSLKHW